MTKLSENVQVNEGSSLTREWVTVHDARLPVDIVSDAGIKVGLDYVLDRLSGYRYSADLTLAATQPIAAVELRFLTFDIWGHFARALSWTEVRDVQKGQVTLSTWWGQIPEPEVSGLYASVAYVARVRTLEGKVIEADPRPAIEEARRFSEKFTPADLEPRRPSEK